MAKQCCHSTAGEKPRGDVATLRRAIYPGTFDPITNGHLDIIYRALQVCDNLIVAVADHTGKNTLFTVEERAQLIRDVIGDHDHIVICVFQGLLVNFAAHHDCHLIIRGIRAISDYEYEFQMALMNRRLNQKIETVFMTPNEEYSYLSSRLVKEVCALGGNLEGLVPAKVENELKRRLSGT
ncbi:pantetheine-phosphate adenylyltransferase [bacterium]|nr:pantetheine-phosphate adenylyltransferase [bacterium]